MRVRVLRMGKAAAASGLLVAAAPGSLGCAEVTDEGEPIAEAEAALSPGAATLLLTGGADVISLAQSTTDEFLRVGEALQVALPAWYLWSLLYPSEPVPPDVNRLMALAPALSLIAWNGPQQLGSKPFPAATWNAAADSWSLQATTGALLIPAKTDQIRFQLTITDAMAPGATVTLDAAQLPAAHVFGGELPAKSLLLDNLGDQKRQRIIEGDQILAGAPLLLGCSDWRAEQIVDRVTIDTQIGVAEAAGRFGWYEYPIQGQLVYEVRHGVFFNDSQGWRPEELMPSNPASALLPIGSYGRVAYEATLAVPGKATKMSLYLHVQAYLVADYSGVSNVVQQWYQPGESILVRDSYDNPSGPFTDYDFSVQR